MSVLPPSARRRLSSCAFALLLAIQFHPVTVAGQTTRGTPQLVDQGRQLFVGQARMRNGGPPCASCHAISSLGFPNGGVVGPDLSGIYNMLGEDGTDVTLQTLYFPTMVPLYEKRPLMPDEQRALKAFFQQARTTPVGQANTLWLAGLAVVGFVVLVAITWLAWRNRLLAVRAPLVRRALGRGART